MAIYQFGFIMEQTLGHITHSANLKQWAATDPKVMAEWELIAYDVADVWQHLPGFKRNWSLRASARGKAAAQRIVRKKGADALFFHTQVTSLFSTRFMIRTPTVISLDATPINYDDVGPAYSHQRSGRLLENLKWRLNRKAFRAACFLVTWSQWAKQSLVTDYGIRAEKIMVIPPGVNLGRWRFDRCPSVEKRRVRLLFVGGDFERKGGRILLEAFRSNLKSDYELHIVTQNAAIEASDRVFIHRDVSPNSDELLSLYEMADIFVFPSLADCLPIAVMEAMAAELPVITTNVGAIGEEIQDGVSGLVVPPNDTVKLAEAIDKLAENPDLRYELGQKARRVAVDRFDGARNYGAILSVMKRCADGI